VCLLAAAAVPPLAPAAAAQDSSPSPWATINACDPPASVGVRVSMPNRRDAQQWIRVRIQYFDRRSRAWRVVRNGGDTGFMKLSDGGDLVLGGTTFMFTPPREGRRLHLRGLVDFEWRRRGDVVSKARVLTEGGHADPADPLLQVSRARCVIRR
jgi:hypothetical protein